MVLQLCKLEKAIPISYLEWEEVRDELSTSTATRIAREYVEPNIVFNHFAIVKEFGLCVYDDDYSKGAFINFYSILSAN